MTLWVDADSCPATLRAVVGRRTRHDEIAVRFVANRPIPLPAGGEMVVVDDADAYIVGRAVAGDIVVTRDIALAARLTRCGITTLDEWGTLLTTEITDARIGTRAFLSSAHANGGMLRSRRRGRGNIATRQVKAFADSLDRQLVTRLPPRQ